MVSPTKASPKVGLAPAYRAQARTARRPQHPFKVITRPYQIQPVMLAPVLPGETLKSLLIQSQVWSDPLSTDMKNSGWWCEYNVFYVKHRDLPGWEIGVDGLGKDLIDMMVNNEALTAHHEAAVRTFTYCSKGGVDYCYNALQRVVEEYFRDEGEAWNGTGMTLDGVPIAQIYGRGRADVFERLTVVQDYEDRRVSLDLSQNGNVTVGPEMDRAWVEWAAMRDAGVVDMTYKDWMRSYGGDSTEVEPDRVDHHRPEDLAYFREFAYPTNTVNPVDGKPAVAVGWRVASRLDKQARFDEPGWLLVTNTVRPKVFLKNQEGSVASMMRKRDHWLPPQRAAEWEVSQMYIPETEGPLASVYGTTQDYLIDIRDLLNYGEQFVNFAPSGASFVALPNALSQRRYAQSTDIDALFAVGTANKFRQDGMVSLSILGRQQIKGSNLRLGSASGVSFQGA